ncbi:hypothetical protein Hypma_015951 [Hypsizygus marmoreus]|uniref:N-acetyltransferase domain-containing protein n=1 Tax=Hypsizygus marmoreus TaxID=39966 RepID=A0A369K689_HYPMA|nr:hypothetical protein Hypma_015951 [Hypsizygus marmoreus]
MANPQLHPLEVNPRTGEPFLRLRKHKNVILTPPRSSDIPENIRYLNDPHVNDMLSGPPVPYLLEHAEAWYKVISTPSEETLAAIEAARDMPDLITVRHCPVRVIREVKEDGEDVFLGDIGLLRFDEGRLLAPDGLQADDEQKAKYVNANIERPVGDPEIVWSIGDYLAPSHHGRGIMTDVLETLLWDWAVPRMGVRRICASAFEGNHGSIRVFERNGFTVTKTVENWAVVKGRMRNLHVVEWDYSTAVPPSGSS